MLSCTQRSYWDWGPLCVSATSSHLYAVLAQRTILKTRDIWVCYLGQPFRNAQVFLPIHKWIQVEWISIDGEGCCTYVSAHAAQRLLWRPVDCRKRRVLRVLYNSEITGDTAPRGGSLLQHLVGEKNGYSVRERKASHNYNMHKMIGCYSLFMETHY